MRGIDSAITTPIASVDSEGLIQDEIHVGTALDCAIVELHGC